MCLINKKVNINKFLFLFSYFILFLILEDPTLSFGISGPFSHEEILLKSYSQFALEKNIELNYACTNMINQFNYQADAFHPRNDSYHCDNSNFFGCSKALNELIHDSYSADTVNGLRKIGFSLHIIQDFYAHSNWVEIVENNSQIAPLEDLKNPAVILLYPNLQSGMVGYLPIDLEEQFECFFEKQENWKTAIKGATHSCIEKDSNKSQGGGALSFGMSNKTYHELAGELAIKHSVKKLNELYYNKNPALLSCVVPKINKTGCSHIVQRQIN